MTHGILSFNADGSFTYTPDPNYHGVDSFTYTATDGLLVSNTATVTITVQSVNDAPIANAGENQNVATGATVQLDGSASSDPDGDALTYLWELTTKPEGSTAALSSATAVNPTFVADKAGSYQLRLTVNDGAVDSAPDTINVEAATVNQSPLAKDLFINIAGDTPATVILRGSDPDGDSLTFTFANPAHGSISGTAPILTYTPQTEYLGPDSFTYQVDDGKGGTATAIVSINICVSSNGLTAYFPFNNNAKDESGNSNDGTINGVTPVADRTGKLYSAYRFDGVNDYISIPSTSISSIYSFTVAAWVRNLDTSFGDDTSNHIFTFNNTDIRLGLDKNFRYFLRMSWSTYRGDIVVSSASTFPDNNYHHVAGVYDYGNSIFKIYVDGKLEGTNTYSLAVPIRTSPHYIGDWEQAVPDIIPGRAI